MAMLNIGINSQPGKFGLGLRTTFSVAVIAVLTVMAIRSSVNSDLSAAQTFQVLGVGIAFLLWLWSAYASTGKGDIRKLVFNLSLVVWVFLLMTQEIFDYATDNDTAVVGNFANEAYGQAILWLFAFAALLALCCLRPQFLRLATSRSCRWAWLLAALCILSAGYAPNPSYSLAWSFKFLLSVWITTLCAAEAHTIPDVEKFFRATLWAFVFIAFVPVLRALAEPATAFSGVGGRLNVNPVELSGNAGALLVLAVVLFTIRRRRLLMFIAVLAGASMLLAFGKTGIIAGTLSVVLFLLLQKKYVAAFGTLALVGVLGGVLLVTVAPLSSYLKSYEGLDTLTGRTSIWETAIAGIHQSPILGHGYVSSRALAPPLPGNVGIAEHMHNGFLEVWFDNGVIGLLALLAIQGATVRNLIVTKRLASQVKTVPDLSGARTARILAVGSLALFFNLILNGLFNSSFGGRAIGPYMLMIALLMMSERLRRGLELGAAQAAARAA